MAKIVLFGTGRAANTAFRYLTHDSEHEVVAFTVEKEFLNEGEFLGLPVVAFEEITEHYPPSDYQMLVFMGYHKMNGVREEKYLAAKDKGYTCASYIHSSNTFLEPPTIGENCFILAHQSIDLDVTIGNNVVMWSQNHIGDRTTIGDNTWITSDVSISGDIIIEKNCFLGVNSTICHEVVLKPKSFISAGAIIAQSTEEGGVYIAPAAQKGPLNSDRFLRMVNIT